MVDSFSQHRASPAISLDQYVRSRSIELGEWAMARERVYLDKCFWIYLRDAHINRSKNPAAHELLDNLLHAVKAGNRVCPISDSIFSELLKQTDLQSRIATAELIDQLSCGLTIAPYETRVDTEIAHFFYKNSGKNVYPLDQLVWTKLSYVLGIQHPVLPAFPPAEQLVIQKAFFDHMWYVPLSKMIEMIGESVIPELPNSKVASLLNELNAAHAHLVKSFSRVYEDEIYGAVELFSSTAFDVIHDMAQREAVRPVVVESHTRSALTKEVYAFLCAAITKPLGKKAFRTLHVEALLYAAMRWNRTQKIDANDLYDFRHACAAIGYCNIFLTDGPMHALLSQRHLKIESDFSCKIFSTLESAVLWSK
jgi:hypothetical protein